MCEKYHVSGTAYREKTSTAAATATYSPAMQEAEDSSGMGREEHEAVNCKPETTFPHSSIPSQ